MDRMSCAQLAELFARGDREVFAAIDAGVLDRASALAHRIRSRRPPRLVLAGAGTSGRLAWHLCTVHRDRAMAKGIEPRPWIAGGAPALVRSVEGAEDDTGAALESLAREIGARDGFLLGISCGLSAPCVAAGLVAATQHGAGAAVFGTNACSRAREDSFPEIPGGFRGVVERLAARGDWYALVPAVGPELVTGSTRLKCGTATWVVLDAVLFAAFGDSDDVRKTITERTAVHRESAERVAHATWLPEVLELAGDTLRGGGRIVYLGAGETGVAAVLDASECPPTFGAGLDQVRGFLAEGWQAFGVESAGLPAIDWQQFAGEVGGTLSDRDLVVDVGDRAAIDTSGAQRRTLPVTTFLEAKLVLNAISTSAFVRAGKVFGNRMIDVQITNTKLFERAVRIVSDLGGVPRDEALRCLVAVIYGEDPPATARLRLPIDCHVGQGPPQTVPLAILVAAGLRLQAARRALSDEPVVRLTLAAHLDRAE